MAKHTTGTLDRKRARALLAEVLYLRAENARMHDALVPFARLLPALEHARRLVLEKEKRDER
jgi:hypothetical protein